MQIRNTISKLHDQFTFTNTELLPRAQYQVNLLNLIIFGNFGITIFIFAYIFFGTVSNKMEATLIVLPGVLVNVWALWRTQHGSVKIATRLVFLNGWLGTLLFAYGSGGIYSSGMLGLLALVVTGVLLLDRNARYVMLVATIGGFCLLLFIELSGNLPYAPFKDLPFRIIVLSLTASSLFAVVNYHVYAIKVAEQKMAGLALQTERNQVQRQISQNIVHDLRTPIATLKTTTYLIRRRQSEGLPVDDYVDKIDQQANHLNTMIEDLFQLVLSDDVDLDRTLSVVKVDELLKDCLKVAEETAKPKNMVVVKR
ncbi:MAG: histidine kinase dimerization/phospho-acceptor domain-containing protein [Chloroflexota bacterium]